jgi:hypothetical protein
VETNPFTLEALPADLVNSVWAGTTPREGDWLTITFKDITTAIAGSEEIGKRIIFSVAIDNSTNNGAYSYSSSTKEGTITISGWNPAPNGFTINDAGDTLTIVNYGSHAGAPRTFTRLR